MIVVRSFQPYLFQIHLCCNQEFLSTKYAQTSVWRSQESQSSGAPERSRESGSSSRSTVSKDLCSLQTFLKNGGTSIDNNHGSLDSNNLYLQPFSRFSSSLNFCGSSCQKNICSPTRRSGGTNFILSARFRRISRCWISR